MKGAETLLRTLVAGGVEVCFTNPGTSEMQFVTALDRVTGMRGILTLFEGVASGAADGYARMAGKPAATLLHLGPGFANGLANFHNAMKAGTPIVNIVGEHATSHLQYDAPLSADIDAYARPVSGWTRRVSGAATIAADTAGAVAAASTPPGRIATLIVPADATWSEATEPAAALPIASRRAVEETRIAACADALRSGDALLLLSGQALRARGTELAGRIAARCGARLMAATFFPRTERGAGRAVVERLPYFAEMALEALSGVRHLILVDVKAPVSFFAYPGVPSWLAPAAANIRTLAAGEDDAIDALARLAEAVGAGATPCVTAPLERPPRPRGALSPGAVAQALGALLPENCIVSDEGISGGVPAYMATANSPPHDWLLLTGGSIGDGMPVATGAAVACPDRKVVNLQADGSAAYTLQALWTQAREKLDVTTIILANRQYQILYTELARVGAKPGPRTADLLDIGRPDLDWVKLAEGMGVEAVRVTTAEAFTDALASFLSRRGPNLIEAVL